MDGNLTKTPPIQTRLSVCDTTSVAVRSAEVHEFSYQVADTAIEPGGFSRIYQPDSLTQMTSYVLRITSSDGVSGEYCAVMGGRKWHMAQVLRLCPALIGCNPYQREEIYDDFKRGLQGVAFVGVGPIDICLWDLAAKRFQTSVPGVGPVIATALEALAQPAETFRRGRDFAAWMGLTPRQWSTGGKPRLGKYQKWGSGIFGAS